jgi:hypothetical protein
MTTNYVNDQHFQNQMAPTFHPHVPIYPFSPPPTMPQYYLQAMPHYPNFAPHPQYYQNIAPVQQQQQQQQKQQTNSNSTKEENILTGAVLGVIGALGIGGLVALGINESKVCKNLFIYIPEFPAFVPRSEILRKE